MLNPFTAARALEAKDAEIARLTAAFNEAERTTRLAWSCRDKLKAENDVLKARLAPFERRSRGQGGRFVAGVRS